MARVNVTQVAVLESVVARLISQVTGFNAANCFISAEDIPEPLPQHNVFCTVWIDDGRFDEAIIEGAGQAACTENAGVLITVANKILLDQKGHHKMVLEDASRGLLIFKQRILKALVTHDLQSGGNEFLRNLTMPIASRSGFDKRQKVSWVTLIFATDFDWDLS